MFAKKECLYIGREKEYSKKNSINDLVYATDLSKNFYLDHLVHILQF